VFLAAALGGVERMERSEDLDPGAELAVVADDDLANIKDDAVEVEEDLLAKFNVAAVIAEEWRLHPERVSAFGKDLLQQVTAQIPVAFAGRIQGLAKVAGPVSRLDQLGVERVVKLARKHLFKFAAHGRPGDISGSGGVARRRSRSIMKVALQRPGLGECD